EQWGWRQAGPHLLRRADRQVFPREGTGPVVRSSSQGQGEARSARSANVPDRHESLGLARSLAATRGGRTQALLPRRRPPVLGPAAVGPRPQVRQLSLRPGASGALPAAACDAYVSRAGMEGLDGRGSALRPPAP